MQIEVEVGEEGNGATFSLSPKMRRRLQEEGIQLPPTSSVYVSNKTREAFEKVYGPISPHIVGILTGLSDEQVRRSGFTIIDPVTEAVRYERRAAA